MGERETLRNPSKSSKRERVRTITKTMKNSAISAQLGFTDTEMIINIIFFFTSRNGEGEGR